MGPDPGQYSSHIKPFGKNDKIMTMGGKYKFVANSNPGPGEYEPTRASELTAKSVKKAFIRKGSGYKVPREANPAPGQYDAHLKPFGRNDRPMTMGGKYR